MIANAKYPFFLVYFYISTWLVGAAVDGVIRGMTDSVIGKLTSGGWLGRFDAIFHALSYDYDWMTGGWAYVKLVIAIPAILFGIYILKESADFLRGR